MFCEISLFPLNKTVCFNKLYSNNFKYEAIKCYFKLGNHITRLVGTLNICIEWSLINEKKLSQF